jgi:hypothetical protein
MKRHDRPYGCTFVTCSKTFGSKNDWKRHENSQHFHLEMWRCDEPHPESEGMPGPCAKVCYRRQTFHEHLTKAHGITNQDELTKKSDAYRIGRNCHQRFWCGFCDRTIELKKSGLAAWTERFDHIDDHFMGRRGLRKQSILDWTPLGGDDKSKTNHETLSEKDSPCSSSSSNSPESETVTPNAAVSGNGLGVKRHRASTDDGEGGKIGKVAKTSTDKRDVLVVYCVCDHRSLPFTVRDDVESDEIGDSDGQMLMRTVPMSNAAQPKTRSGMYDVR